MVAGKVPLTAQVHSTWGICVERLIFAGRHGDQWIRVETTYNSSRNAFEVPADQTANFRIWARQVLQPTRFVSFKLGSRNPFIANRYDWSGQRVWLSRSRIHGAGTAAPWHEWHGAARWRARWARS